MLIVLKCITNATILENHLLYNIYNNQVKLHLLAFLRDPSDCFKYSVFSNCNTLSVFPVFQLF